MNTKANKPLVQRRDGAGHINPRYAAGLRARSRETASPNDDAQAFLDEASSSDSLAEQLGETFVQTATSGEDCSEDVADEVVTEEDGGPFVESAGRREFGYGPDESNPQDAEREPFPRT